MGKKDLSLKPHNITNDFWWYEENAGISIHVIAREPGAIAEIIPWRAIRNALKRKDK